MNETIVKDIAPILISLVVALIGWGVAELTRWIRQKTKSDRISTAFEMIGAATVAAVKEAEVTIRPTLTDGKLTPEEIASIKTTVTANVKRRIGPAALKVARENLPDLDDWINAQTEAEVYDLRSGHSEE